MTSDDIPMSRVVPFLGAAEREACEAIEGWRDMSVAEFMTASASYADGLLDLYTELGRMECMDIVEKIKSETGYAPDDLDRVVHEFEGWRYGERIVLTEDTGLAGEGEEGYLLLEWVGAPQYHNLRVAFHFLPDGSDCPDEVQIGQFEVLR